MTIIKYLKIYRVFYKFGIIFGLTYRVGFIIQLLVEFGYQLALIFFFQVIYGNIKSIAGWTYYEIMFLTGITIVVSELMNSSIYVFNLYSLPRKIIRGEIDFVLLKPIHSLFYLASGMPYISGHLSILSGVFLAAYSLAHLSVTINPFSLFAGIIIFLCGLLIFYSLSVIISSLSFKFLNAEAIPILSESAVTYFMERPHEIYQGIFKYVFFLLFPVVYIVSIPSATLLKGFELSYLLGAMITAGVFLYLAVKWWNLMIKGYASASS